MELEVVRRALQRHLKANSLPSYEKVLQTIAARDDIWATSQGEYVAWWSKRRDASLKVWVADGQVWASTDLDRAALEKVPDQFLPSEEATACGACDSSFSGEVQIVVDASLMRQELLVDALQREGIMNTTVGESGEFLLSHELDPLLEEMETHLRQQMLGHYNQDILKVRDAVTAMLAERGLPLIRIWYHPQRNGRVVRAVFSPRYDVDRAITNMPKIIETERKYGASSTAYVRTDQPFYGDADIVALDALSPLHEVALHAEFATHALRYGGDLTAAQIEKTHLERVLGRPVMGISLHGGELTNNRSPSVWKAIEHCRFGYDTSHGPMPYYLPYRQFNGDGRLETTYRLRYHFRDIDPMLLGQRGRTNGGFYEYAMATLDQVYQHNGVMVLLLHPIYFGFFQYLCRPRNLFRFVQFVPTCFGRVLRLRPGQTTLRAGQVHQ